MSIKNLLRGFAPATLILFGTGTAGAQLSRTLDDVTVTARHPLSETGVQRTVVDSVALKENIALSMADVLGFNSSVFVKTSGRATLSTVAFRGTAPSHTQVTWNGMPVNSPSLGMTDFSMIPSYFVDRASLLHGSSSLLESTGGLGGSVSLATSTAGLSDGWGAQYVQGLGLFATFDEFLRVTYASDRWRSSTRVVYSSSDNDFKFVNHDKKVNIYDDDRNLIGQYHPEERNANGAYGDLHILQDLTFIPSSGHRIDLSLWFLDSDREIPLTTVDYVTDRVYENRQRENTFRSVLAWTRSSGPLRLDARAGYAHTWMAYDYGFGRDKGPMDMLTVSRTHTGTLHGSFHADWTPRQGLLLSAAFSTVYNSVSSVDRASLTGDLGYDRSRAEEDLSLSARWQATDRFAASLILRENLYGDDLSPLTPALFVDWTLLRSPSLRLKGSIARNHHFPTLNDLYFIPGGNPDLRPEDGFTYDVGISADLLRIGEVAVSGSATWFDSYIDDWILWLPTTKGFFSPRNMKKVHSYGIELEASAGMKPFEDAGLDISATYSWTPSVNRSQPLSEADRSVGKQLPYVPVHSASATARLSWRSWGLLYKCCYYSKRYTMSSNESSLSGSLPHYFMSDVAVEKKFGFSFADLSVKLAVNNLFDADYQTVMSHPMPGINFEFFIGITPRF